MSEDALRITEIFLSLQGESSFVGLPTVFVRLTGCPLRCHYCDTEYAFHGGERKTIAAILSEISGHGVKRVCVTGGEPLAQPGVHLLLRELCDQDFAVSLETSGALATNAVDSRVVKIVDFKTPGSGEVDRNLWANVDTLGTGDQVKFVICNRDDYEWMKFKVDEHRLRDRVAELLISPSYTELAPAQLAEWMLQDRFPGRMQLQMHKQIWGEEQGR